jgi:hypothetical protein
MLVARTTGPNQDVEVKLPRITKARNDELRKTTRETASKRATLGVNALSHNGCSRLKVSPSLTLTVVIAAADVADLPSAEASSVSSKNETSPPQKYTGSKYQYPELSVILTSTVLVPARDGRGCLLPDLCE